MKTIVRYLLLTACLAAFGMMQFPSAAQAQSKKERNEAYWRNYWHWYDSTYRPYYQRRSTLYAPPLPDSDPRVKGSYGPGPYYGPYWGGGVAYGPGITYGWW
jgi:hypothetical protein